MKTLRLWLTIAGLGLHLGFRVNGQPLTAVLEQVANEQNAVRAIQEVNGRIQPGSRQSSPIARY